MKILSTSLLAGILTIGALMTGCQTSTGMSQSSSQTSMKLTTYPITHQALQANNWQLIDATHSDGSKVNELFIDPSKPLTLNFLKSDGHNLVSLINTCNRMSSSYSVDNGTVKIGTLMSTLKACPEPQAKFDSAAAATIQGQYTLSEDANKTPVLVITNDNQVSHFKAVPKTQ